MSAPAEVSRRRIIREAFFDWLKEHAQLAPGQTLEDATDHLMTDVGVTPVLEMVIAERALQIEKGFDAAHDDGHEQGELLWAGLSYVKYAQQLGTCGDWRPELWPSPKPPPGWPFEIQSWHPRETVLGNLVVGIGVLIAEAERLMRLEGKLLWEVTEPSSELEQGSLPLSDEHFGPHRDGPDRTRH